MEGGGYAHATHQEACSRSRLAPSSRDGGGRARQVLEGLSPGGTTAGEFGMPGFLLGALWGLGRLLHLPEGDPGHNGRPQIRL
jgi:hypothetical protein